MQYNKNNNNKLLAFPLQVFASSPEPRCCSFFSAVLDRILFILAGNNDIHESLDEFEILPDSTTDHRVSCPLGSKNRCCYFFSFAIYLIHFKFVGIKEMHNTYYLGGDQLSTR